MTDGTRERILDVALDLFVEKGYDKTSLREIADRMGFTKAALYYHFASKSDMLMALHMRLHQLTEGLFDDIGSGPVTTAAWERFLDEAIDRMQANRKLFLMHQRNPSAFEDLHTKGHDGAHAEMEERLRVMLSDPSVSEPDRVRMAAAFAAAFATTMMAVNLVGDIGDRELTSTLRSVVGDILRPKRTRAR